MLEQEFWIEKSKITPFIELNIMIKNNRYFNFSTVSRILLHLLFWYFSSWFFYILIHGGIDNKLNYWESFPKIIAWFTPIIVFSYINLLLLMPKYLKAKRYWTYLFWLVVCISIFTFLMVFDKLVLLKEPIDRSYRIEAIFAFSWIFIFGGLAFVMKIIREWFRIQDVTIKLKEAQKQKLEAELSALKAQVNPHFLFNTLNNIYSLSLDKSDRTPELVLKLSDLMSYTLYECKEDFVPISKEIEFINNYIELERIRLNNSTKIQLNTIGNYEDCKVAPLLFIPFIENAFKHGVNQRPVNPYINIAFNFSDSKMVRFTIENNKPNAEETASKFNGIGIDNARKRLNLLYENKHNLEITNSPENFKVNLTIAIS